MSYLIKNKKYSFMIIFFICCFFFIGNASALVYKGPGRNDNIDNSTKSGTLNNSTATHIEINVNSPIDNTYDYIAFKLVRFNFANSLYSVSETQSAVYCSPMTYNSSTGAYYCSTNTVTGLNNGTEIVATEPSITNSVYLFGNNTDSFCTFSSEYEDYIICPTTNNTSVTKISFDITSYNQPTNVTTYYSINISKSWIYLNNDSTDIINALSGVNLSVNGTTSAIEQQTQQQAQQNAYVQNSNISQAQTNTTTSITTLNDQLTAELSQFSDLTQLVLAPITIFMELNNNVCAPLTLQIPFVNQIAVIPCMKPIMQQHFGTMYSVFTTVIGAILCYWTFVRTVALIKDLVDADNDKIEVVDL